MSSPEVPDFASMLDARMPDAPDNITTNDAPLDVALEATATRAEQPAAVAYPVEPAPPLG
jgi:hypothetical protein